LGTLLFINNLKLNKTDLSKKYLLPILIFFCTIGCIGPILADTTPKLSSSAQINSYGKDRDYVYRNYNSNLIKEFFVPKTWLMASAKGALGFIMSPIIFSTPLKKYVPNNLKIEYELHYSSIPKIAFIQIIFLFSAWIIFSFYTIKIIKNNA